MKGLCIHLALLIFGCYPVSQQRFMQPDVPEYPRAYQANALVRAPLKLTHVEARIFALALGCIHQGQTELPGIVIPLSRVLTQKKGGSVYETIRDSCKSLMSKVVSIESRKKDKKDKKNVNHFRAYSIISYIDIDEGSGLITGNFAPEIKPFLLQLAEHYTTVEIETLLTFRSAHAHRLYWLLKSWDDVGVWEVPFEILRRQMLGDDNDVTYTLFYDFKRYVLEPAVQEMHSLNWMISYEPLKEGKKVQTIRFTIPKPHAEATAAKLALAETGDKSKIKSKAVQTDKQMSLALPSESTTLHQRIVTRLQKLKLTPTQIQHLVTFMGDDEASMAKLMKLTHPLLRDYEAGNKAFDNLGGATINLLKAEFPGLYPALKNTAVAPQSGQ